MILSSKDFLIICMLAVEALEIVDAEVEDHVEAKETVVDFEELVVDRPTSSLTDFGIVRLYWPIGN